MKKIQQRKKPIGNDCCSAKTKTEKKRDTAEKKKTHVFVLKSRDELPRRVVVRDRFQYPGLLQHLRRRAVADGPGVALTLAVLPGGVHGTCVGTVQEARPPKLLAERLFSE